MVEISQIFVAFSEYMNFTNIFTEWNFKVSDHSALQASQCEGPKLFFAIAHAAIFIK